MSTNIATDNYTIEYVQHTMLNQTYFVPSYALDRPAVKAILSDQYYEPDTHTVIKAIYANLKRGSLIHAGTFFGDMLPSFSSSVSGHVYAFEPVLENYILARLCVEKNNLSNVILFHAALSDGVSNVRVNTGIDEQVHRGGASFIDEKGVISATLAIDNLSLSDVAVIQLDVEGHELKALQGAVRTIQKSHPIIMIEDLAQNCDPFLTQLNYKCVAHLTGLTIWTHPAGIQINIASPK